MATAPATAPTPKTPSPPSPANGSLAPPPSPPSPEKPPLSPAKPTPAPAKPPSSPANPPPAPAKPPADPAKPPPSPVKPPPLPGRSTPPTQPQRSPPSRTPATPLNPAKPAGDDKRPPIGGNSPPHAGNPPPHAGKPHHRSTHKPSSKTTNPNSIQSPAIIGGIAAICFTFLALIIICRLCNRKKKKPYYIDEPPKDAGNQPYYAGKPDHVVKFNGDWRQPPPANTSREFSGSRLSASPNMPLGFSKNQFSYEELAAATRGFTQSNLLGQGGFGFVHKGVLPNGQEVAVKSLKAGSGQGEREFQAEVEIISRVHHRHLVSLVGYCISNVQRMLVYEFVPNKTLEYHLHGTGGAVMDWQTRMCIALGSAKGLAYLHEDCHPRIIHRDIKSANILLDHNYEAMVADFGLAKLSSANDTHVSTRVMGTFGYLAPEYASSGKLSEKSDVFSYGVMLLEILTGRKPVDPTNDYMDDSLVDWASPLIDKATKNGDYSEVVDPRLEGNFDSNEMAQMASCAAAAVHHSAKRRPKMSQIIRALEGGASLDSLDQKTTRGGDTLNQETSVYDTRAYNNDMMKFKQMVMSSQEFQSSDYSGPSTSSSEMTNSRQYKH